jgi:hypothetical protein
MEKQIIFVSCGQRTSQEKQLGSAVCELVRRLTSFNPYFAEFQSNLGGLNENIIDHLEKMTGIITILHPRGDVHHGGEQCGVRASVWVEQEIAIAAYIQRTTKKSLLTAAYVHSTVTLEGLRTLLHLNPLKFDSEADIIRSLESKLPTWTTNASATVSPKRAVISLARFI